MATDLQRLRRAPEPVPQEDRSVVAGLDALETTAQLPPKPGPGRIFVRSVLPPIVFLALLVGVWQLAFMAEIKPPYALPSPAHVWGRSGRPCRTAGPPRRSGSA